MPLICIDRCLIYSESTITELGLALHMKSFIYFGRLLSHVFDRYAPSVARDSPLPTQRNGNGMMDLEELDSRGRIERHNEKR